MYYILPMLTFKNLFCCCNLFNVIHQIHLIVLKKLMRCFLKRKFDLKIDFLVQKPTICNFSIKNKSMTAFHNNKLARTRTYPQLLLLLHTKAFSSWPFGYCLYLTNLYLKCAARQRCLVNDRQKTPAISWQQQKETTFLNLLIHIFIHSYS